MADMIIVEGADGIHDFFLTEGGSPFNITGATAVTLEADGFPDRACTIISGSGGQVRYTRIAGDYQRGLRKARIWVTLGGLSYPSTDFTLEIEAPFP